MSRDDLKTWINSLAQDIDFQYYGRNGSICPFSRENISLCFDGNEVDVHSVSEAMSAKFIDGYSLMDICEEIDF